MTDIRNGNMDELIKKYETTAEKLGGASVLKVRFRRYEDFKLILQWNPAAEANSEWEDLLPLPQIYLITPTEILVFSESWDLEQFQWEHRHLSDHYDTPGRDPLETLSYLQVLRIDLPIQLEALAHRFERNIQPLRNVLILLHFAQSVSVEQLRSCFIQIIDRGEVDESWHALHQSLPEGPIKDSLGDATGFAIAVRSEFVREANIISARFSAVLDLAKKMITLSFLPLEGGLEATHYVEVPGSERLKYVPNKKQFTFDGTGLDLAFVLWTVMSRAAAARGVGQTQVTEIMKQLFPLFDTKTRAKTMGDYLYEYKNNERECPSAKLKPLMKEVVALEKAMRDWVLFDRLSGSS